MSKTQPNEASSSPDAGAGGLHIKTFHEKHASIVADWVQTEEQLRRLAPGTTMPLTGEKVLGWRRSDGYVFVLTRDDDLTPIGYAELNPMRRERGHLWLGHVIVDPAKRGQGIGVAFVRALLDYAFGWLGAHRISLIVFPENAPAVACYERVGFERVREEYHTFTATIKEERMLRLEIRPPLPDL